MTSCIDGQRRSLTGRTVPAGGAPADPPGGTIDTPLGPARWVHLSGDATTISWPLWPMADPAGGLLWFGATETGSEDGSEPALWASEDAVSPRHQVALPASTRFARLDVVGGAFWLTADDPQSLWRSADARIWEAIDLSNVVSPGPPELRWSAHLGTPATSGALTAIPIAWTAYDDAGRLLRRPDQGGRLCLGRSARASTPSSRRVRAVTSTPVPWCAWRRRTPASASRTRRASASAVPGRSSGYTGYPDMVILGTEAGFTAFRLAPGGTFRAWHSGDGRAWTEGPLIGTREGEPQQVENLYRVSWPTPTVHASTVHGIDDERAWETTDGVSWTAVPRVVPGGGYYDMHPLLTGGWLWLDGDNGVARVSTDGESWERVPGIESLTKWQTEGTDRFGSGTVVGDTLFWSVHDVEALQRHDLWVIEFDPAAAANATP